MAAIIAAERHDAILRELRLRGTLTSKEFSERLGVSDITLRRDLRELEDDQKLVRVRGGARAVQHRTDERTREDERRMTSSGVQLRSEHDPPKATIGMIAPTSDYYYAQAIEGAKEAASSAGVRLVLAITEYQPGKEVELLERMVGLGLDGVLITPGELDRIVEVRHAIEECPLPVTVVERAWEYPTSRHPVDSVRSDHAHGGELAARHLAELGHRRVAMATMDNPHRREIGEGFSQAATAIGCELVATDFDFRHPDWDSGDVHGTARLYLTEIMERGVTAVLVYPDGFALAILQVAAAMGIRIPEQLSVIAYDDELAELAELPLTAVAPPKRAIGLAAMDTCLRRLAQSGQQASPFPAQRTRLLPVLNVRDSTAAAESPLP